MNTTPATIRPLTSHNSVACLKPADHMPKMIEALRASGLFTIDHDADAGTVKAHHTETGREVLIAIQKGEGGPWITRHHRKLFE
jgi:hypothetical protein